MINRQPPTHKLVIEIPLNMDDPPPDYSPAKDAIHVALGVSKAAFDGYICDVAEVWLVEVKG